MRKIIVLGGGVSSLSFISTIIYEYQAEQECLEIEVISPFGLGFAPNFFNQPQSSLCNSSSGVNSIFNHDPLHFVNWLKRNGYSYDEKDFVPRSLYGMYLGDVAYNSYTLAKEKGIKIVVKQSEFSHLKVRKNKKIVTATNGEVSVGDMIVFGLGHKERTSKIHNHMYYPEEQKLIQDIPNSKYRILVVGSRLSAIDVALLVGDKDNIKADFISSSGYFPAVRSEVIMNLAKYLSKANILKYSKETSTTVYKSFVRAVRKEIRLNFNGSITVEGGDPYLQLKRDLSISTEKDNISWQKTLDNIMFTLNAVWPLFTDSERELFFSEYGTLIKRYLYSFPGSTAKKICELFEANRITMQKGEVNWDDFDFLSKKLIKVVNYKNKKYDYVIDASGCVKSKLYFQKDGTISLMRSNSPLLFKPSRCTPVGVDCGIYLIGSMRNSLPVVNYVREITFHASNVAKEIVNNELKTNAEESVQS